RPPPGERDGGGGQSKADTESQGVPPAASLGVSAIQPGSGSAQLTRHATDQSHYLPAVRGPNRRPSGPLPWLRPSAARTIPGPTANRGVPVHFQQNLVPTVGPEDHSIFCVTDVI